MHRVPSGYYSDDEPLSSSPSSYSSCDSIDEVFERYRQYRRRVRGLVQSFSDLDDNMVINQGTNNSRQPQLGFHSIHGVNVERKQNNRIARRKESFCKGLAFSNRPISIDECVCLRLTEVATNWSGVLRFGVTNVDPETYRAQPVPKFACPDLTSKTGYWAKALPERFSTQGNVLHFFVNTAGELIYGINGSQKGIFLCGINTSEPLWIIVDIYGNSVAVEFVDSAEFRNERSRSSSVQPRTSGGIANPIHANDTSPPVTTSPAVTPVRNVSPVSSSFQLTAPSSSRRGMDQIRFHQFHGRNINLVNDRSVASRMVNEYTQGYVFTERPVNINEKIVIQILEVQQLFNGGLAFGVTCCDPASLRSVDMPENSGDLVEMPQYWVGIQDIALQPTKNAVLSFWITETAEVKMRKDAGSPHTVLHVDTSVPLYMWFDCYGTTQSIKLIGTTRSQSPANRSSSLMPTRVAIPSIPATTSRRETSSPRREGILPAALKVDMRTASRGSVDNVTNSTARMTVDDLLGTSSIPMPTPPPVPSRAAPPVAPRTNRTIPAPPTRPPPPTPTVSSYTNSPTPSANSLTQPTLSTVSSFDTSFLGRNVNTGSPSSLATTSYSEHSSPRPSPAPRAVLPPVRVTNNDDAKDEDLDPSEECTVCMSAKIDAVIYTCGHMCMCYTCAKQTQETQGHCPLCRKPIQDVIRCYKS